MPSTIGDYRCNETLDLEEIIKMNEKHNAIMGVITYQSGRQETIYGKLQVGGQPYKTFAQKIEEFRAFPTVTDVKITTYAA
jgi:hypothetical protein